MSSRARPKYLNLFAIRLPMPGILSILHRASGALLIIALPFALGMLQWSMGSKEEYEQVVKCLSYPLVKLCVWGVAWALFHHICAGMRFLLLDFHIGASLSAARFSAGLAFAVSIAMTVAFGAWLW